MVQGFGSPSIVPGSDILVNGENWQHNIPGLEYKLFLDNVFESSHPVVFCNQSPSFTVSLPCAIGVGNHAARVDLVKPTTQEVLASKQTTFSVVGFSIVSLVNSCQQRVQSVELKEFSNNDQLTPNRDPVSGMFIGKKIFPDKNFPQEALQQSANRRKVRVIATTTIDVPPGTKVFFKAYDVDDPESDGVIDPNGTTGDDNRGIPKQGSLSVDTSSGSLESMCPDMNGDCWARTNNNREAVVEFVVTMHAGDNFMIAASTDQANFMVDANGTPLSSNLVTVSEMLTVWRRLHVELDFMDKVAGNRREVIVQDVSSGGNGKDKVSLLSINQTLPLNQFANGNVIFGNKNFQIVENAANIIVTESLPGSIKPGVKLEIVDDDDFNSDDIVNKGNKSVRSPDGDEGEVITAIPDLVALFQESDIPTENVFARAYIIPILDGGGAVQNNTPNTSFQLNSDTESRGVIAQVKPYIQTANLVTNGNGDLVDLDFFGTDDFWITYVQICYQANELEDNDPDTEPTLEASTIVVETSDAPIVSPNDHVPLGGIASLIFVENSRENSEFIEVKGTSTIIPHEVGHQFGLDGDTNSTDIMGNRASTTHFLNKHLNIIRWRVHSPGKDR